MVNRVFITILYEIINFFFDEFDLKSTFYVLKLDIYNKNLSYFLSSIMIKGYYSGFEYFCI